MNRPLLLLLTVCSLHAAASEKATAQVTVTRAPAGGAPVHDGRLVPIVAGLPQITKLLPGDSASFDGFGNDLSIDGDVLLVGASTKQVNGNNYAGAAYVFRRHGASWIEEARLTAPTPEIHDNFGRSVAIQGDVAVIGAPDFPYSSFSGTGRVWVFRRLQGVWSLEAELVSSPAAWDSGFGNRVALDGDTILVGAFSAGGRGAFVFEHVGSGWMQTHRFDPPSVGLFGSEVALVGDVAMVSDRYAPSGSQINAGAVYAYHRSGSTWIHEATLTDPSPQDNGFFGSAIAFDGSGAAIGASGSLELFLATRQAGVWTIDSREKDPNPAYLSSFGSAVDVDEDVVLSGVEGWGVTSHYAGGLAVYRRQAGNFVFSGPFVPTDSQSGQGFGRAVSIDGATCAVSAGAATSGASHGAVYVFDVTDRRHGFHLEVSPLPLQIDEDLEIRLRGAQPAAPVGLYSSIAGLGATHLPGLSTSVDLASATLVGTEVANSSGRANWSLGTTPAALAGVTLWYQAAQFGESTEYVASTVIP